MSAIKFGLTLPYPDPRSAAELARLAEDSGWDGVFLGDAIWTMDPMICLAAAATATERIRLGTMILPAPLRKPWKIASESLALDHLSNGRMTLGLGTGAVWMGWQGFPGEVTATRERAEMLEETVDILTGLFLRKPFDYPGKHFPLKLSLLDEMHYPPKPVQQPRIPLWVVGAWPRMKSVRRALKCDGILPLKMDADGKIGELTPADVSELSAFIRANRPASEPFDIVVENNLRDLDPEACGERLKAWEQAGVTWLIEGMWGLGLAETAAVIRRGPPAGWAWQGGKPRFKPAPL